MKKISMLFLSLLTIFLLTGCGAKEEKTEILRCINDETKEDMYVEKFISMTYKNDKLKRITIEVSSNISDSTIKENWEEYKKTIKENNKEFNKDGISLTVSVNDQIYQYDTFLDIDVKKANKEKLEELGITGLENGNITLEDSRKKLEENGTFSCEIRNDFYSY